MTIPIEPILMGSAAGLSWGILGYITQLSKGSDEQFDAKKFCKSWFVGAGLGAVAGYQGYDLGQMELFALTPVGQKATDILKKFFEFVSVKIQDRM